MFEFPPLQQFMRVSQILANRLWAEANAGNMSMRVDPSELPEYIEIDENVKFGYSFPVLNGDWYFVTATKSRARDMERIPSQTIGLVELTEMGARIVCRWGAYPPTSEFPAHMSIYSACRESRPEIRAVLHTHPPNLIAMTHLPYMQDSGYINTALRSMHPEVPILVPDGVACLEFKIPGSMELGTATGEALLKCRVAIWPMHGVVSIAENLDKALDQIEILEKAATIYMLVRSTGQEPVGLSPTQINDSCGFWGVAGDLV